MTMKKVLSLFLAAIVAAAMVAFTACTDDGAKTEERTLLYDFEAGTFGVGISSTFGKITVNDDEAYVASGTHSLKLAPSKDSRAPYMYLSFRSNTFGFDHTDVSDLAAVEFQVYAETEAELQVGLYFSSGAEKKSVTERYALDEGWNTVTYVPNYALITLQYDLAECCGVYLMFDGTAETMPTVWLDAVTLVHSQVDWAQSDLIRVQRTDGYQEICDFENAYQDLMFVPYGAASASPELTVVEAADYGLSAPSGERMLMVELHTWSSASNQAWTQIAMCEPLLNAIGFSDYAADAADYELCMQVYQYGDDRTVFGNVNLIELNLYTSGGTMDWGGFTTKKGEWVEVRIPLTQFSNFVADPGQFMFAFLDPVTEGEYIYFFDDLRIVRTGT